jgi:dTDP-4-dehydrorhamnose 3,5-epimerase
VVDPLAVRRSAIPGLLFVDLPLHVDARGWFKENWQRAKMVALGLPDFAPVQNNISFNAEAGVTRGIHAEPWDKLISVAAGRVFGAWVDLRAPTHTVVTAEIGPQTAVFVPSGVGNGFQTLEPGTSYSYLVNDHWSPAARDRYSYVNLADPSLAIEWPIPLAQAITSAADRNHPLLVDAIPPPSRPIRVLGSSGQLGRALSRVLPGAVGVGRDVVDLADPGCGRALAAYLDAHPKPTAIINAAAYTAVDEAETAEGRRRAWAVNAEGVARLVETCRDRRIRLVHISSDYVFDGSVEVHDEHEPLSPLGVYAQTKAAADLVVAGLPDPVIVRTSWLIGQGRNFVATMMDLARRGITPDVIDDQFGRLTFADELAAGITHLLDQDVTGVVNLTSSGPATSWADIADQVFAACGRPGVVRRVSTAHYHATRPGAPRPRHSVLALDRLQSTGFQPKPGAESLARYLREQLAARVDG